MKARNGVVSLVIVERKKRTRIVGSSNVTGYENCK